MKRTALRTGFFITTLFGAAAWAQSAGDGYVLEEITVTATKRATDLQKTSMSVTAIKGDELRTTGKTSLTEILEGVPNLETAGAGSGQGSQFYIRGVGFVPAFGQDAAVTTSVNGVFLQQAQSSRATFYDLERVEVSRGPLSTLQGRNALGGSVNIISAEPKLGYEASGSVGVGNYQQVTTQGMLNVPLSKSLAVRGSFTSEQRDGYLSNGADDSNVIGGRLRALYKPSEDFKLIVTADYSKQGGKGSGFSNTGLVLPSGLAQTGFNNGRICTPSLRADSSGTYAPSDCLGVLTLYPTGSPAATPAGTVSGTSATFQSLPLPPDEYWSSNPDEPQRRDFKSLAFSGDLTWNLGWGSLYFQPTFFRSDYQINIENFNLLTYATRLQQAAAVSNANSYAYAANLALVNGKEESVQKQQTYELRLTSPESSRLQWMGGLYYFRNEQAVNVSNATNLYCATPTAVCSTTVPNQPTATAITAKAPAFDASLYPAVGHRWTRNYAAYAQLTWPVRDTLRLTGSARWTQETKWRNTAIGNFVLPSGQVINAGFTYLYNNNIAGTTTAGNSIGFPVLERQAQWDHVDYRAAIEYDIRPDSMVYATISTGFRGGSFLNLPIDGLAPGFRNYYDPEYLTSYEFGTRNDFLDRTLRVNATLYYYDYTDYQYQYAALGVFDPVAAPALYDPVLRRAVDPDFTFNYTANAAKATSFGGELEASWIATPRDQFNLNVAYTHGRFGDVSLPGATSAAAAAGASLSGVPLPRSPEWSFSPGYRHRFPLAGEGSLTLAADASYKSKIYFLLTGDAALRELYTQSGVTKYNSSLSYDSAGGMWNVTAFVRNITDEASLTYLNTAALNLASSVPTSINYIVAEPRTFGLTISAKF